MSDERRDDTSELSETTGSPSLAQLPDPIIAIDLDGVLRYANRTAADVLGWDVDAFIGRSALDLVHPDDANLVTASLATITGKRFGDLITVRVRTGRGTWTYLEIRGTRQVVDGEELVVIVARDTTDRHGLDLDQGEDAVLRAVMANMHGMVALVEADGRLRSINGAITRLLGHDPELIRGEAFIRFVHADDRAPVLEAVRSIAPQASLALDARFATADGGYVTCEFTVNNLVDDPVVRAYVISGQPATALTDARRRVEFLAEHDSRTGLLNRDGFMRGARELLRDGGGIGLLLVDIVQFRAINELYGEPVGDRVLTAIAGRIDEIHWPDLVTARLGGDEFVLAVRSSDEAAIEMLRERVRRDVGRPVLVGEQEINVGLRAATSFESRPQGLDSLLASASAELMSLKRNADPTTAGISFDAINQRRRQLDQLRRAIDDGEVQPFFQPIVGPAGEIIAVEALVRWVHPVRGVLGVAEILPLAQMAGLAAAVDEQVFDLSFEFARRLHDLGHRGIEVHVNVDPKVIAEPAFADRFLARCHRAGADPGRIVVEITETDLLAPGASSLANMQQLRRAGAHVSIDDFGTGYSSLAHLLELPGDGVKIDRRFVAGIDVDPAATNLTTAILGLSDSLGLTCVAEGVEQPYQRDRLLSLGCQSFQGWLYSPAVSADTLVDVLPRLDPTSQRAPS
jgi:diguanylate cyclase (GGDEF)-like protein/PAS domain S-box-containing protein